MQIFPRRWDKKTCINFLQRKIIINSIIYYELNTNKLSDKAYDELSRQLVELYSEYDGNIEKDTQYGYAMYDFDGSTGFDLYGRLNDRDKAYLRNIAQHITGIGVRKVQKKKRKGGLF